MTIKGLKGSIVALVTPFNADGSINFTKLGELIDWHVESGTDGVLVLGTTGETPTLTHAEDDAVVEYSLKRVGGRVPLIVGSGSNSTQTMKDYSLKYQSMGADACLVITPYYNKANAEGMYRHFATVADAVDIPLIMYNVPGRTGCALAPEVVGRLCVHPNIVAIKEASGSMSYAMTIARYLNEDFAMYSGNDDITVPLMSIGGSGIISVWANIMPRECHEMVAAYAAGDVVRARDMQLKYLDVMNALFYEVNPIPVKAAMNMMGLEAGPCRLPLYEMSEGAAGRLRAKMQEVGLI